MTSAEIESSISHVPFNGKIVLPPRSRATKGASLSVAVRIAKLGKHFVGDSSPNQEEKLTTIHGCIFPI